MTTAAGAAGCGGRSRRRPWRWCSSRSPTLGAFKSTAYTAVPHGSHDHYVPDRCGEGAARTGEFPMREPREGERITCDGNLVSE